ncbi:MAG: 3'-5' exonuclease [Draconibacterium sp.]
MLSNLDIEKVLFIDIETVPAVPVFEELPENWQHLWKHKMQFKAEEGEDAAALYQRAGIYAEFGRIICISAGYIATRNSERQYRVKSFSNASEKELLTQFFEAVTKFTHIGKKMLCAHNGYEFDFPFIARRALVQGVKLPPVFDIAGARPWEMKEHFLDTLQLWKFGDYKHYTSLSLLCALFEIPTPKDDIDGSQVAQVYWVENDLDRIVRYCEKDTLAVANLLLKYKGEELIQQDQVVSV